VYPGFVELVPRDLACLMADLANPLAIRQSLQFFGIPSALHGDL
jgi:hypothetical protein